MAGDKTWVAGEALGATALNGYVRDQTTCISTTAPANLLAGKRWFDTSGDGKTKVYDGTNWVILDEPAQSWTPSITNLTVGNGTWTNNYYKRSDGWIYIHGLFTFGTTSAIAGTMTMTLPVAAHNLSQGDILLGLEDTGANVFLGYAGGAGDTTTCGFGAVEVAGTYARTLTVTSTVPFTWGSTDRIQIRGYYRMTTRYS